MNSAYTTAKTPAPVSRIFLLFGSGTDDKEFEVSIKTIVFAL